MLQLGTEERRMENNDRKEKRTNRILFLATGIPASLAVLAFFGLGTFKDVRNALFGAKEEDIAEEMPESGIIYTTGALITEGKFE